MFRTVFAAIRAVLKMLQLFNDYLNVVFLIHTLSEDRDGHVKSIDQKYRFI